MSTDPDIRAVETGEEYYHVRFRNPDRFTDIRTPEWAEHVAEAVCSGSVVRTGRVDPERRDGETDDWQVQSVLIPVDIERGEARSRATEIVESIAAE